MAFWTFKNGHEVLRVSSLNCELINEIKDCNDKKKIEIEKLKNIEQLLAMTSAMKSEKVRDLIKSREKTIARLDLIDNALEVLNTQTYKS